MLVFRSRERRSTCLVISGDISIPTKPFVLGTIGGGTRRHPAGSRYSVKSCVDQNSNSSSSDLNSGIVFNFFIVEFPFLLMHVSSADWSDTSLPHRIDNKTSFGHCWFCQGQCGVSHFRGTQLRHNRNTDHL